MQDYAEYASELVERIDAGELDPEEVDIRPFVENESDVFTPALRDRLEGSGKIEEYNLRVRERDWEDLSGEVEDRVSEHEDALDALRDSEDDDTAAVTVGETDLTVKTYLSEEMERKFERLQDEPLDTGVQRRLLPEVMAWLVEAPEEYASEDVWRAYAAEYGRDELALVLFRVLEPKMERAEQNEVVEKFRERAGGRTVPRSEQSDRDADI